MKTEKKTPEEEKKPDAPAAEQKDEPKPEEKPADGAADKDQQIGPCEDIGQIGRSHFIILEKI